MTGEQDVISDGERVKVISGGDGRICRITGSGCMLSALCALKCGDGTDSLRPRLKRLKHGGTVRKEPGRLWMKKRKE